MFDKHSKRPSYSFFFWHTCFPSYPLRPKGFHLHFICILFFMVAGRGRESKQIRERKRKQFQISSSNQFLGVNCTFEYFIIYKLKTHYALFFKQALSHAFPKPFKTEGCDWDKIYASFISTYLLRCYTVQL